MIRIGKVNVQFDLQILNEEGAVVDSKVGNLVVHEAGFDVTLKKLSEVLADEYAKEQANQEEKEVKANG